MPSLNSNVGPLDLPIPPGALNADLDDPVVTTLLAFFGHWISATLDSKLAQMPGAAPLGAAPTQNRFAWDPSAYFVRGRGDGAPSPFPALYVWWQGRSARAPYSTLRTMRQRPLGIAWIFDELTLPGALEKRHGLLAAVDAALVSACDLRYHPTFAPRGMAAGTDVAVALHLAGFGLRYAGAQEGKLQPVPGDDYGVTRQGGHTVRAYPTLQATVEVWEMIEPFDLTDPADVNQGLAVSTNVVTEAGPDDALPFGERRYGPPDGSEG